MVKLESISDIFKKDQNGNCTKNTELARKILSYVFENQKLKATPSYSEPFYDQDLASWLLDDLHKFIHDHQFRLSNQMNRASKVEKARKRIRNPIDELCKLDLIERDHDVIRTGTTDIINVYRYTFVGHVIALLIELTEPNKLERVMQTLYSIFNSQLGTMTSSYAAFYSLLFKKYMEKGVFDEFLNDVFLYRLTLENEIITKDNLFASMDL